MNLTEPEGIVQAQQRQAWDAAYRAGRIAALREVGCGYAPDSPPCAEPYIAPSGESVPLARDQWCVPCRLLAEAESGEDTGEVGDDR
ncbi:MAG: hypothetical protein KGI71_04220 [Patescibacteria group bacterium]|nr:hypothetical protein [Patescibacteria group bacterium]